MNLIPLPIPNLRMERHNLDRAIVAFDSQTVRPTKSPNRRTTAHPAQTPKLRLGHVHLKVRDLKRSVPFYISLLGLHLTERVGRYAFLAIGEEHHSIALEEIGAWSVNPARRAVGVAHVAFEMPDRAAFVAMRKRLGTAKLPFISRNSGTSWAVRFKDPDGNEIEIYVDRRHSPGGTLLWEGRWHGPLQLEEEAAKADRGGCLVAPHRQGQ